MSKIFEKIMFNRISNFNETNNLPPTHQYSFRASHSIKDAILDLTLQIENNKIENMKTCRLFLHLSKAFDMVDHSKLLSILSKLGLREHSNKLMKRF